MKKLLLILLTTILFGQEDAPTLRELNADNFNRATSRGLVLVEFWAPWNEANKVTILDKWDTFDVKSYRLNIELFPEVQSNNNVVILPTLIFYDDGEEVERLQGDMSFSLKITIDELEEIVEEILSNKF